MVFVKILKRIKTCSLVIAYFHSIYRFVSSFATGKYHKKRNLWGDLIFRKFVLQGGLKLFHLYFLRVNTMEFQWYSFLVEIKRITVTVREISWRNLNRSH